MRQTSFFYRRWLAAGPNMPADPVGVGVILLSTQIAQTRRVIAQLSPQISDTQTIWVRAESEDSIIAALSGCPNVRPFSAFLSLELNDDTPDYVYVTRDDALTHAGFLAQLMRGAERAHADLVYGDDDLLRDGARCLPQFKPCFDPILLDAYDYIGPNFLLRSRLLRIHPDLLDNKSALRMNASLSVAHVAFVGVSRYDRQQLLSNDVRPTSNNRRHFSFVIPTKSQPALLKNLIEQIFALECLGRIDLVVLNNADEASKTHDLLDELKRSNPQIAVQDVFRVFNWSQVNNQGARACSGEILVFLNDDMTLLKRDVLDQLDANFNDPEVGIVGGLLTFPSGQIQHAGVVIGMGGFADHIYRDCTLGQCDSAPFVAPGVRRTVSAITGAFMAVRRDLFERLGGFDEALRYSGDVEFCVRARGAGFRTVYDPSIRFTHHESLTRGADNLSETEKKALVERIQFDEGDPYYHPRLSVRSRYPVPEV